MERKQMQDLIQRLWDKGAGIEIIKILEHDKQQREALARVEAEQEYEYYCKVCRNHGCVSGCHPDYYTQQES